jgi:hypothetical protein
MYRKDFFQASKLLKVEVEECSSTSAKIDRLLLRTRTVKVIHLLFIYLVYGT